MVTQAAVSPRKPRPVAPRLPRSTQKPRPTAAPSKAAYKPRVQFVSATEYLVPSETYAPHLLYLVVVQASGVAICECAGYTYRRACKHGALVVAIHAYRANPRHLRPATQPVDWESLAAVCAALPVPTFDFRAQAATAPAPAFIPAPPAFSELFAA